MEGRSALALGRLLWPLPLAVAFLLARAEHFVVLRHHMNDAERKKKIEEMRARLADVPASVQLARLDWEMRHCWKCESEVAWGAEVCETCGNELMTHGKH